MRNPFAFGVWEEQRRNIEQPTANNQHRREKPRTRTRTRTNSHLGASTPVLPSLTGLIPRGCGVPPINKSVGYFLSPSGLDIPPKPARNRPRFSRKDLLYIIAASSNPK